MNSVVDPTSCFSYVDKLVLSDWSHQLGFMLYKIESLSKPNSLFLCGKIFIENVKVMENLTNDENFDRHT